MNLQSKGSNARSGIASAWEEVHLFEIAAAVASRFVAATKQARTARGEPTAPDSARTAFGVEVIVSAHQRDSARVANVATLASTRDDIVALEAAARLIQTMLAPAARIIVERAHVTLCFTLTRDEERAFRDSVARFVAQHAPVHGTLVV